MSKNCSKKIILTLCILSLIIILFGIYKFINGKFNEHTKILELKNSEEVQYSVSVNIATIRKNYTIINSPTNLYMLKNLIQKFLRNNPVNVKFAENEIKKQTKVYPSEINKWDFEIFFYRESNKLPRGWQPDKAHMEEDEIENHADDCIAAIFFSKPGTQIKYSVMKKSSSNDNYGDCIEDIEYINDKIVDREINHKKR